MSYVLAMEKPKPADRIDGALVALFLLGIYLDLKFWLPGGIPVPAILAGAAGGLLLLKHSGEMTERHFLALVAVLVLYLGSLVSASGPAFVGERFKGFIQLAYSLLITYGFFLAASRVGAERLSRMCLIFCVAIIVGCALENYTAFKQISDSFRSAVFQSGVYDADTRDEYLYGLVRPKLFTSEPSMVTFGFTLFAFAWYALTANRYRLPIYLVLLAAAYVLMRGPTLMLGVVLIPIYEILVASRRGPEGRFDGTRVARWGMLTLVLGGAAVAAGSLLYGARLDAIASGEDASFFARVVAPALTAVELLERQPVAGAGLTGWEYIDPIVVQIYATAKELSINYWFDGAANAITNYFWLHWIFLGLLWGAVLLVALTWLLHALGVRDILFCWLVWVVLGQAMGGYVSPRTWTVLMFAAVIAVLCEQRGEYMVLRRSSTSARPGYSPPAPPRIVTGSQ